MRVIVTGGAGFIDAAQVAKLADPMRKNEYGQYLLALIERKGAF